jgi:acetyltransferase EpsM
MQRLIILGGGGHAQVVADAIDAKAEFKILGFVANTLKKRESRYPLLGIDEDLPVIADKYGSFDLVIAVGDGEMRRNIVRRVSNILGEVKYQTTIHPSANIASDVKIESGCFVAIGASVAVGVKLGAHVLVNTNASVDHDCLIGHYASIGPNAALGGYVQVGDGALIGIGATVLPGIRVGAGSVVGAGAVVTRDVQPGVTVWGVPARKPFISLP